MSTITSRLSPDRIRRADVFGYLFVLLGLSVSGDYVTRIAADGPSASAVAGAVLGFFAIVAGVHSVRTPAAHHRGRDPASRFLFVLASVATVAFAVLIVTWAGRLV